VASAPVNLLVADVLAAREPAALFVLCLRRLEGVCQSLRRSYLDGYLWAGADAYRRVDLWCDLYEHALDLPKGRTVVLDYDALCAEPRASVARPQASLEAFGFPSRTIDVSLLARFHASQGPTRPTAARFDPGGALAWTGRKSWDEAHWLPEERVAVCTRAASGWRPGSNASSPACPRMPRAGTTRRLRSSFPCPSMMVASM
jgi:hypothetical protein